MTKLDNLTDKQNHLLAQLSYQSHQIGEKHDGKTVEQIKHDLPQEFYNQLKEVGLDGLTIKKTAHDPASGFGAIAFMDASGNVGMSFRGTDGVTKESLMTDWPDNFASMATGSSVQSDQAKAFFSENDINGNNFLYGHSKGGELATSIFVDEFTRINQVHILNPQPINPYGLTSEQKALLNSPKYDVVVNEWDFVWWLGICVYMPNIRFSKKLEGSPHDQSSVAYDENGTIIPSSNAPANIMVGLVAGGFFGTAFQVPYEGFSLVNNLLMQIIDSISNADYKGTRNIIMDLAENNMDRYSGKKSELIENWLNGLGPDGSQAVSATIWSFIMGGFLHMTDNPVMSHMTSFVEGMPVTGAPGIGDAAQWFTQLVPYMTAMCAHSALTVGLIPHISSLSVGVTTLSSAALSVTAGFWTVLLAAVVVLLITKALELIVPLLVYEAIANTQLAMIAVAIAMTWIAELSTEIIGGIISGAKKALAKAAHIWSDAIMPVLEESVNRFFTGYVYYMRTLSRGAQWIHGVYGTVSALIANAGTILATLSRIDDLQRSISNLNQFYHNIKTAAISAKSTINQVAQYYNEYYVRNCCRDIDTELNNALRYIEATLRELEGKRRVLLEAIESYRYTDDNSAKNIIDAWEGSA